MLRKATLQKESSAVARDSQSERRRYLRLDQPHPRRTAFRPRYDPETFGQFSERIARLLGTGRFLVYMTVFILTWVVWNVVAAKGVRFDSYPFIFLTLILSLQASYAAPLILLAQNRQDDRDRVNLEQDRTQNARMRADTEYLAREVAALRTALGDVATRDFLRSELETLLKDIEDRRHADMSLARRRKSSPDESHRTMEL